MTFNTERQDVLAGITGRTVPAIRHMQAHGYTPWDDKEFEAGQHRRYSGKHALALILAEMLAQQGLTNEAAASFVKDHDFLVNRFLDQIERGETVDQAFVAALYMAEEDSMIGLRWTPVTPAGGSAEEIVNRVSGVLSRVGHTCETRNGRSTDRIIGGLRLAVVHIPESYRLLKKRALDAGFGIDGRRIYKLQAGE